MKLPKPRKRGDAYRIEIMFEGKRYSATRDSARDCEQWAAERLLSLKAGRKVEQHSSITFRELVNLYNERVGQRSPSRRQIREKINTFDANFGQLGEMQIHQITPQHLTAWRNKRLGQVSNGTVLKEISLFSSIFSFAKTELFAISDNPWFGISKPPAPAGRHRRISREEVASIVEVAGFSFEDAPKQTRHYVVWAFLFAIETAMRRGEILNIRRPHIYENHVHVPFSKNGMRRDVPLSDMAKRLLSLLPEGDAIVPRSEDAFKKSWQRLLERSGIRDLHFHDTRHEAISRMVIERRLPVEVLAKITGHKKIQTLVNTYYNPTADEIVRMFSASN
jgi:putative integrase/recombinase protein